MFAIEGDDILTNRLTAPYLNSMPGAANEGLQLLATAGRFIKRDYLIVAEESGEAVEEYWRRYDFAKLVPDFYSFNDCDVYALKNGKYRRREDLDIEGDGVIMLPVRPGETWRVYYNAYPGVITADTPEEAELAIHPESAALLPLYMASQLFKEDDIGMATQYRNEFEVGREILLANARGRRYGKSEFLSETRWW